MMATLQGINMIARLVCGACMAGVWWEHGWCVVGAWPVCGGSMAGVWWEHGRCVVGAWLVCGGSMAGVWWEHGWCVVGAWLVCGGSMAGVCIDIHSIVVFVVVFVLQMRYTCILTTPRGNSRRW